MLLCFLTVCHIFGKIDPRQIVLFFSRLSITAMNLGTMTNSRDQKNRTLEALERRFAVAKAELFQNQKKGRTKSYEGNVRESEGCDNASKSALACDAAGTQFSNPPPKKDLGVADPAYLQLAEAIHENLLNASTEGCGERGTRIDGFLHELLKKGDSAHKYIQGSRRLKVDSVILLDNYVQGHLTSSGSRNRNFQNRSKRSRLHMSMKKFKQCGSFGLPQDLRKFDKFMPMHEMWKSYMMELVKSSGKNQIAQCILNADLHGAIILVAQCKVDSFVGSRGIMIRETAETIGIITRDNKFRVVPKKDSVFLLQVDCWKVTLLGDKLIGRDASSGVQ